MSNNTRQFDNQNQAQAQNDQVSAQGISQPARSPSGLSADRRLIEKRRRDAIRKALGKG